MIMNKRKLGNEGDADEWQNFEEGKENVEITFMLFSRMFQNETEIPLFVNRRNETSSTRCMLDGGSLIYRLKGEKKKTYAEIADFYSNFVSKLYGNDVLVVVFAVYNNGPSTKDNTHQKEEKSMERDIW